MAAGCRGDGRQVVDSKVESAFLERRQGLAIVGHWRGCSLPDRGWGFKLKACFKPDGGSKFPPGANRIVCFASSCCVLGAKGGSCAPITMADEAQGSRPAPEIDLHRPAGRG